ncbi:hypothetical protein ON010_g10386 [Phytophthora cinnamomi]|nr:hypothetical protein ON010_g10386 [Phytophthora cinnamomi]
MAAQAGEQPVNKILRAPGAGGGRLVQRVPLPRAGNSAYYSTVHYYSRPNAKVKHPDQSGDTFKLPPNRPATLCAAFDLNQNQHADPTERHPKAREALQRRLLGRDWRLPALFEAERDARLPEKYVALLRWFADAPDVECRYSIHHMVKLGMQYDKLPGEWYGPTTAAQVLRDLVNLHRREFGGELAMYVPQEGVVYTDDVTRLCVSHMEDGDAGEKEALVKEKVKEKENVPEFFDPLLHPPTAEDSSDWSTALLILIPLRLGLDQVNERYVPALEKTFAFPQSVGVIGGKKGHSVYFVGTQQDQLHLLDPHDVHPAPELNAAFPTAADGGMCPFSVAAHRPDYAASGGDLLMADCLSGDDMNEDEIASADRGCIWRRGRR